MEQTPVQLATGGRRRKRRRGMLRDTVETVLIVLVVFFGFRTIALPYEVDGASMSPYLHEGERLFVSRASYAHFKTSDLWNLLPWEHRESSNDRYLFEPPERGEIIVLNPPYESDESYIKRVIGLPGERVSFVDGKILIDGVPLTEEYIDAGITSCQGNQWCDLTVPERAVFVLGDNRQDSTDSRVFGPIGYDEIIGKAVFANWPINQIGPIESPDYDR